MTDDHPFFRPKMPFKPVPATKCPKCNKNVYAAEEGKFYKSHFAYVLAIIIQGVNDKVSNLEC